MVPDRARRLVRDTAVAMMARQAPPAEAGPRHADVPMRPRQGPGTLLDDLGIGNAAARPNRVSGAFLIRIGILLLALLAVALYGFNRFVRPASLRGVVNAPMVTLRAPIDGTLVRGGATVGQAIAPGTDMFAVRDPRVDLHRKHLGASMRAAGQEVSLYQGGLPPESSVFLAEHLMGRLTSASDAVQRAEIQICIQAALNSMDEIDREVLVLRHFEMLTNEETAEALGLKKAAASNRYLRALKRLKAVISEVPGFLE